MTERTKPIKISYASRSAIGSLFKAVTLSTDPAHTLGFTASLVNSARSSLIYKLEQHIPDDAALTQIFGAILKMTATKWVNGRIIDEEAMQILDQRISKMFPSESIMRYDLETYRDVLFCDDLGSRWKDANHTYLQDSRAWAFSNEQLADINRQLMEIIIRHDLMEFPKGEGFNLDEHGTDVGAIAASIASSRNRGRA